MRIASITATPFSIPFRRPLVLAGRAVPQRRGVLVELVGEDGTSGLGEASPHPAAGSEVIEAARRAIADAGPSLIGAAAADLEAVLDLVADVEPAVARAGLEMAAYDMAAKAAGVRVADLLGGAKRDRIPVNAMLDHAEPAAAVAAAREAVRQGFRCLKLKLLPHDVAGADARMGAVRAGVGPEVALRVDANGGWTVAEAVDAIPRLAAHGLEFIEQPVACIEDMAAVRREVETPIAADEDVLGVTAVRRIADAEAADIVVVKPALLGLTVSTAVIRTAYECGLGVAITSTLDTSIGIAAAVQLAATLPDPIRPCGLATASLLAADLVREPIVASGGELCLPAGPGLGVRLARSHPR